MVVSCRVEGAGSGATRYCELVGGASLREKIIEVDPERREGRYSVVDGERGGKRRWSEAPL